MKKILVSIVAIMMMAMFVFAGCTPKEEEAADTGAAADTTTEESADTGADAAE